MITDLYQFNVDPESLRSELLGPTAARVKAELVKAIANDADTKIRQALIELGWTPPPADFKKPITD